MVLRQLGAVSIPMKRICLNLLFIPLLLGVSRADIAHPVQARLLSDLQSVTPGDSMLVGIELRMEQGWHTYWRFSGDAGLPTEVSWRLPVGGTAGELMWPIPERYAEAGDLTVYGYADSVLLMANLVMPKEVGTVDRLSIGAHASWLVCRELCIPGGAELQFDVEVGNSIASADATLLARNLALIPIDATSEPLLDVQSHATVEGDEVRVALAAKRAQLLDFFPITGEPFEHFEVESTDAGNSDLLLRMVPFEDEVATELSGVVIYGDESGEIGYREVSMLLPPAPAVGDLGAQGSGSAETVGLLLAGRGNRSPDSLSPALFILFALAGGLILNLMPCVLPVISIKVLNIVSQASEDRSRIRRLGAMFSAGIVSTFLALALLVLAMRAGGEQIGWGFQFQYPGFVMAMAAIVFLLSLSLFGLFALRLPGTQGSLVGLGAGNGLVESFANGVLATILATPCTAPFLGAALGFAFTQPAAMVLLGFLCIGLGMALPYALLALEPAWLRLVPRPGAWMEQFKQAMGFLFVGTTVWLLWVLGRQLGMEAVVWMLSFLLCLAIAAWIIGQLVGLGSSASRRLFAWLAAGGIAIGAYALFLHPLLSVNLPRSEDGHALATGTSLQWEPFSIRSVETMLAGGEPVFIDFTAEWCLTCKVNERIVFSDEEVRRSFAERGVRMVKADWTKRDDEITRTLRSFGRSGVPLYVLFQAGGEGEPWVFPEIITADMVLEQLHQVPLVP